MRPRSLYRLKSIGKIEGNLELSRLKKGHSLPSEYADKISVRRSLIRLYAVAASVVHTARLGNERNMNPNLSVLRTPEMWNLQNFLAIQIVRAQYMCLDE